MCRGRGTPGGAGAPASAAHGFKNVYRKKGVPQGGKAWYGRVDRGKQYLRTGHYHTPEEAARAVDRCGLCL